jgi:CBS domain-containing protein
MATIKASSSTDIYINTNVDAKGFRSCWKNHGTSKLSARKELVMTLRVRMCSPRIRHPCLPGDQLTTCREIMKRDVHCLASSDSVILAAGRMRDQNVGFLPVCDAPGRVVGTITDRDIAIRFVAEKLDGNTPVEQIMTREVVACDPDDDLFDAAVLMATHRKSRIMCVGQDGRLVGVISLSDIAQFDGAHAAIALNEIGRREQPTS